jgi:hypothetical protein
VSPLGPQSLPYPELRDEMALYMRRLIREGSLPHDLLHQFWFRGGFEQLAPHEVRLSRGTDYFPVDALFTPDGVPETLAKKDYSPARVAELFERGKQHARDLNRKREAAGKEPRDLERVTIDRDGLPVQIDGVKCKLLSTFFEAGINHKTIIEAVLKPLGYAKAKGKKDSYQKWVSKSESLTCYVGVPAIWRVRELFASLGYCCGEKQVEFRLLYWGAFHRVEWQDVDNMDAMTVTTERIFRMAIENIGFLVSELEVNCLGEWRKALGDEG